MPKTYNTAGQSTRQMAEGRRKQGILWGIVAIIALIVIFVILQNPQNFGVGGIGFLVLLVAMRVIVDQFDSYSSRQAKKVRRADRGAEAEEKIGGLLDNLDSDFEVLHDVDSPFGNIDHLVISRQGGIYLLETKSHRGTITTTDTQILLNGHDPEKDFVSQALKNSYWLRDEVEKVVAQRPWITPVVVFTNAFVKSAQPVKGVRVINQKYLLNLLKKPASASAVNSQVWNQREALITRLLNNPQANDTPSQIASTADLPAKFCPKCGAELVQKTVKSGATAGKAYMVCPRYSECKTAFPIPERVK
jgi:hypothetical protein